MADDRSITIDPETNTVFKRSSDTSPRALAARSEWLRDHGVHTPPLTMTNDPGCVRAPFITGLPGSEHLQSVCRRFGSLAAVPGETLQELLAPMLGIHAADAMPSVPRLDPFLRIMPRLEHAPHYATMLTRTLKARLGDIGDTNGTTLLHGDYHVGQLVLNDRVWIVDLDDMCTGPREFDLANFYAHLVTSPLFTNDHTPSQDLVLREALVECYEDHGEPIRRPLFNIYIATSLLRRLLKLSRLRFGSRYVEGVKVRLVDAVRDSLP